MNQISRLTCRSMFYLVMPVLIAELSATEHAWGQKLQPDFSGQSNSRIQIQRLCNLADVAKSASDYKRIVEQSEKLLRHAVFEKEQQFLRSLVGWSKNRLGCCHFDNYQAALELGADDQAQRELNLAKHQLDDVIERFPTIWRAWNKRAEIHCIEEQFDDALEKYRNVLELESAAQSARFNCAELCRFLQIYDEAIVHYSDLIDSNPVDVESLTGRGHCYRDSGFFTKAISDYEQVIKLLPSARAYCNLANALADVGLWADAKTHYENAVASCDDGWVYYSFAQFLLREREGSVRKRSDAVRAINLIESAIQIDGEMPEYKELFRTASASVASETANQSGGVSTGKTGRK